MSHLGGWMVIIEMMMMMMVVVKIMMEPTCPWTALRRTVCQVRTVWSKLTKWLSSQVTLPGILTVMGCMVRMSPIPGSFYSNLSESSPHKPISIFKVIENFDEICKTDMWNRYWKKRIFTGFRSAILAQGPCLLQVLETTSTNHSDLLLKPKNLHVGKANTATTKSISQSQVCVNHSSTGKERVAYSIYRMFVIPVLHTYLMQECTCL